MLNGGLGIGGAPGLNLSLNLNSPIVGANQSLTSQLLDQIKLMLRSSGCSEHVTAEISTAMATLAKYVQSLVLFPEILFYQESMGYLCYKNGTT